MTIVDVGIIMDMTMMAATAITTTAKVTTPFLQGRVRGNSIKSFPTPLWR